MMFKCFTEVVLKRTDWRQWQWFCAAVVFGGEAAGAGMSAGENGCGVSICW